MTDQQRAEDMLDVLLTGICESGADPKDVASALCRVLVRFAKFARVKRRAVVSGVAIAYVDYQLAKSQAKAEAIAAKGKPN